MSSIILTEKMKKRSLLSTGDDARLCSFFNKLRRGVSNQGFQSWNLLCANIISWKNKEKVISEF